jgi:hypothetical protein
MPPTSSSTPFSGIFISYRRDDSSGHAGRLFDNLVNHFGRDRIFMDIDTIEPGEDFVTIIENAVASCDLLIAVIGQNWLSGTTGDAGRLDDPLDFVRVEIATALDRDIRVIPVLVQRAMMPLQRDLPDNLTKLARRNAIELSDLRWQNDVEQLIKVMDRVLAQREQARLANLAQEAEAKRQREVEEEERWAEEKRRLLAEAEAERKATEQAKRETEEKERLALAEKRRVEEERQKAYEEQQRAFETARRQAEERARVALAEQRQAEQRQAEQRQAEQRQAEQRQAEQRQAEQRQAEQRQAEKRQAEQRQAEERARAALAEQQRAEEESRRQQAAARQKKIDPVSTAVAPKRRRTRMIIIASSAFVTILLIVSVFVLIALLGSGKLNPQPPVSIASSASPVPALNTSPTPTPTPTPDRVAFERGLTAYIKSRLVEGEAEVKDDRRVLYGDLNGDSVDEAVMSYCVDVPADPTRIRHCDLVVFKDENGVLKYLSDFPYEGANGLDQSLLARSIKNLKIVCRIVTYQTDEEGSEPPPNLKGWLSLALDGDKLKLSR